MKRLFIAAVAAGLIAGCGAAFLMDAMKPAFRRPNEIESLYRLPVLASIPKSYKLRQITMRKINVAMSIVFLIFTTACLVTFAFICMHGSKPVVDCIRKLMQNL